MSRTLTPLTDEQLAAIAWADASETTTALAHRLAAPYFTVRKARERITRAGGWWRQLTITTCSECDQPLLTGVTHPRRSHAACTRARGARRSRQYRAERRPYALSTPYDRDWQERHPERAAELYEREKAALRARWPGRPPEERETILARAHEADRRDQPFTRERAVNSGAPWTADEDEQVVARMGDPAREVALDLGRTLWAVRGRRVHLRRRLVE